MVRVDFVSFTNAFDRWAQEYSPVSDEQVPIDGKGIKVSLRDYDQSYQDFVKLF